MKNARQEKILELIEEFSIDTQDTLIKKLNEFGFNVTQTTVSRDIRQLNLIKGIGPDGSYKYISPSTAHGKQNRVPVLNSAITDSVTKIEAAENIVVIKTFAGMANAIAVCVDSLHHDDIVGSVAGDDTIIMVVTDNEAAYDITSKMKLMLSGK